MGRDGVGEAMKYCGSCQTDKPFDNFHKDGAKADGYHAQCKTCRKLYYNDNRQNRLNYNKNWNDQNKDRIQFHNRKRKSTIDGRAKQLWHAARTRANDKNLEFNICENRIKFALFMGKCERTGIDFIFDAPPNGLKFHPFAPSIDRIDPNRGYIYENIAIVCWSYNVGKHSLTHDEFVSFCKKVVEFNS